MDRLISGCHYSEQASIAMGNTLERMIRAYGVSTVSS